MKSFTSFLVLLLAAAVQATSSSGSRLVAIFDDLSDKASYSKFLRDLEARGFAVTYETPKSESLSLFHLGARKYDHAIFFPTKSKGLGPNLTPNILVQFVNAKGNLLVALSSEITTSTSMTSLLNELDISLPAERKGLVVDHFNYDINSAGDMHDVILLPASNPLRPDVKDLFGPEKKTEELLAFPHAVGMTLGQSTLLSPVVRAPPTAYSYNPKEQAEVVDDLFAAGAQLNLVSAVQARNSARVVVVGAAEMLTDKWFDAKVKKTGEAKQVGTYNREFAKKVSGWTFMETGVLRVNWMEHHLNEEGAATNDSNPKIYRVKNDVTYSISVSEYAWDKWTAFTVPAGDELQLEFSMLSPFHRLHLQPVKSLSTKEATTFSVSFKLPDQHGIFNFKINYKRPFFSNVEEKSTVSVRHMAHDEWPRSWTISAAWPWMTGITVTVSGWLAFCAIWMFSQPVRQATTVKKVQ